MNEGTENLFREVVIIDFETTGLRSYSDRIIEVGAVLVSDGEISKTFSQLMNPGKPLPSIITDITGISDEMLEGKPTPEDVMPALNHFISDRVIIAHNAGFDYGFIKSEMTRAGIEFSNSSLCTLKLARRLIPQAHSHKLTTLANMLEFPHTHAHRALDDAIATAHLWNYLTKKASVLTGTEKPSLSDFELIAKTPSARLEKKWYQIRQERFALS